LQEYASIVEEAEEEVACGEEGSLSSESGVVLPVGEDVMPCGCPRQGQGCLCCEEGPEDSDESGYDETDFHPKAESAATEVEDSSEAAVRADESPPPVSKPRRRSLEKMCLISEESQLHVFAGATVDSSYVQV